MKQIIFFRHLFSSITFFLVTCRSTLILNGDDGDDDDCDAIGGESGSWN